MKITYEVLNQILDNARDNSSKRYFTVRCVAEPHAWYEDYDAVIGKYYKAIAEPHWDTPYLNVFIDGKECFGADMDDYEIVVPTRRVICQDNCCGECNYTQGIVDDGNLKIGDTITEVWGRSHYPITIVKFLKLEEKIL